MGTDTKAQKLLQSLQVLGPDHHVYQLGCTAGLLNVHAQQKRAFNLVWALLNGIESHQFPRDIGIVGGGISALTAATALIKCGAKVHVYERMRGLMHLQQGNSTRFLHPNIALWPNELFGYPITHLPFMNWRSGSAGDVAEQLNRQWRQIHTQAEFSTNTEVTLVQPNGEKIVVHYMVFEEDFEVIKPAEIHAARLQRMLIEIEDTKPSRQSTEHDAVIIASGYGLETPRFSVTPSYWRNDDFAQPVLGTKTAKRFLVSGTGDGGLIDALRLTIRDFHHQQFFQQVMYQPDLLNLGRELQKRLNGGTEEETEALWDHFIRDETIHVGPWPTPTLELERKLDEFIRDDTLVVLNSRRKCPFITESLLLHKILVAMLIRKKRIRHIPGELIDVYRNAEPEEFVALIAKKGEIAIEPHYERVDVVVERHNADPTLPNLLGTDGTKLYESLRRSWRQWKDSDPTIQNSPIGFLADEYRKEHFEESYEIGIFLDGRDPKQIAHDFLRGVSVSTQELESWLGMGRLELAGFTFRLKDHTFFIDDRHANIVKCLSISTSSRADLERALDKNFEYHYYKVFVLPDVRKFTIDPGKHQIRPFCWIVNNTSDNEAHIEVQCWNSHRAATQNGGMFWAHKFLRVPHMLEILGNRWPRTKLDGLGWALCLTREILHTADRAYQLLQWDNHFAWWLPVLNEG